MLREMSWAQLREWMVFAELEPFPSARQDWHFAHVVSVMNNIMRDAKKVPLPYPLKKFLLRFGDDPGDQATREQTPKERFNILTTIAHIAAGVKRKLKSAA